MNYSSDTTLFAAADMQIAFGDIDAQSANIGLPVRSENDALEVYRAYDDGGLEEAPQAFAAYLDFQQRQWL